MLAHKILLCKLAFAILHRLSDTVIVFLRRARFQIVLLTLYVTSLLRVLIGGGGYSLAFCCTWAGEDVGSWGRAPA